MVGMLICLPLLALPLLTGCIELFKDSHKTIGLIPAYTDGNKKKLNRLGPLFGKAFIEVVSELEDQDVELKNPIYLKGRRGLHPSDIFKPYLIEFYKNVQPGTGQNVKGYLKQLMRSNGCDILFWATYSVSKPENREQTVSIRLYGYRIDNDVYLNHSFDVAIGYPVNRNDLERVEDENIMNFQFLIEQILKG